MQRACSRPRSGTDPPSPWPRGRRLPLPQRCRQPLRRVAAAASGLGQVCGKLIQVIGGQRRCPRHDLEQELGQVTSRLRLPQHSGESAKRLDDRAGHDHRHALTVDIKLADHAAQRILGIQLGRRLADSRHLPHCSYTITLCTGTGAPSPPGVPRWSSHACLSVPLPIPPSGGRRRSIRLPGEAGLAAAGRGRGWPAGASRGRRSRRRRTRSGRSFSRSP